MSGKPARNPIRRTLTFVAVVGGLLAVGSLYMKDARFTASVLIGACVALLNLWVLAKIVKSMMPEEEESKASASETPDEGNAEGDKAGGSGWGLLAVIKILALFGGAFGLWKSGIALPLPTLLGYGALPIGIVLSSIGAPRR